MEFRDFKETSMEFIKKVFFVFCFLLFFSCGSYHSCIHLFSPDKSQCITIITNGKIRYVIDGEFYAVPDNGYVKLDLSNIDPVGDAFAGCWQVDDMKWQLINDGAEILENKMNDKNIKILTRFPSEKGIPTLKGYTSGNCFNFDFETLLIFPEKAAVIEQVW